MSAIGPKRTSLVALHMSAFGGKADMTLCGNPLLRSLLGVKRTWAVAPHMSAYDPKRTWAPCAKLSSYGVPFLSLGGGNETARVHHACRCRGGGVAAQSASAAAGDAGDRLHRCPVSWNVCRSLADLSR